MIKKIQFWTLFSITVYSALTFSVYSHAKSINHAENSCLAMSKRYKYKVKTKKNAAKKKKREADAKSAEKQAKLTVKTTAKKVDPAFLIGPEDVLEISVWKDPTLNKQVVVRPDGKISFPLVGELEAGGFTVTQLEKLLVKKINKYIPDPIVTVMVLQINSQKIYVLGKVARPGVFNIGSPIDVMKALTLAGGLNAFAKGNKILILRKEKGNLLKLPFDYEKVAKGKSLEQNIALQNNDVLVVP